MNEPLVALAGLAGTLATAGLAYVQFKRTQRAAQQQKTRERTQAIHETIWQKTEAISLLLRNQWDDGSMTRGHAILESVRELNVYISQNQLFVEAAITPLATNYISAGVALAQKLSEPQYHSIWLSWYATQALRAEQDIPKDEKELTAMFGTFRAARERFVAALKKPF